MFARLTPGFGRVVRRPVDAADNCSARRRRKRRRKPESVRPANGRIARRANAFRLSRSFLTGTIESMEQSWSVKDLTEFVAESVGKAREGFSPFYHLQF